MYVRARIPGEPHVHFVYVPSQNMAVHVSGLDPLKDGTMIENAIKVALAGLATIEGGKIAPFFAIVYKAVWLNIPAAAYPFVRRSIELSMCPALTGINYRYRRYYVTSGEENEDDEEKWELKEEEDLNPLYDVEKYADDGEPLVLAKPIVEVEKGWLYALVLYNVESRELNRDNNALELKVKATAVGYIPIIVSSRTVCEEKDEMHHRCDLDPNGALWSRRFTIDVYEQLFEEERIKEEKHVLAFLKHGSGYMLKHGLNYEEKSKYEGRTFSEKALSKIVEYYAYVLEIVA